MSDVTLTPDDVLVSHETPAHQLRLVTTGLVPTADVPLKASKGTDTPPCYAPCARCGIVVLTGITSAGMRVALETGIATYVVDWPKGTPQPVLSLSRGYPVHRCVE